MGMSSSRCIQLKEGIRTEPVKQAAPRSDAALGEEPYAIIILIRKRQALCYIKRVLLTGH